MKFLLKLCNGDASHSPNSPFLLFLLHILYLFFVLFTCAITPISLCLPWPWVPRWQTPPTIFLMMTSRNEQRKPRTYCLLLKHDARDTRRKMKIKSKWSLDVMWKNCLAFITTTLTIDDGLMQKLNLHQMNKMKKKIFLQAVNVFIYKQTTDLINDLNINSLATLVVI